MNDKLYNFIRSRVSTNEDAEDVYQATKLASHKGAGSFEGRSSVNTWETGIAVNLIRDGYRRGKIDDRVFARGLDAPDLAVECDLSVFIEVNEVLDAMCKLPLDQLDVISRIAYGESYEEVAKCLQIPIGTVRSRLSRARTNLVSILQTLQN